jgi:hypothetical protein
MGQNGRRDRGAVRAGLLQEQEPRGKSKSRGRVVPTGYAFRLPNPLRACAPAPHLEALL